MLFRFAIVEDNVSPEDIAPFRDGVVLVNQSSMAATVLYYLSHDEERRRIAARGRELFMVRHAVLQYDSGRLRSQSPSCQLAEVSKYEFQGR